MILKIVYKNLQFAAILLIVSLAVFYAAPNLVHMYYFHSAAATMLLMMGSMVVLIRLAQKPEKFVQWFLILFVFRFLFVASLFLVLRVTGVQQLKLLVINFFIVYLIYLVFEITQLLSNLRANS